MSFRSSAALARLVRAMDPREEHATSEPHPKILADRLRDPKLRAEFERLRVEMVEQLAPAAEGPIVNPGRRRRGRLVFGDATE
jgi:hypothetical protein